MNTPPPVPPVRRQGLVEGKASELPEIQLESPGSSGMRAAGGHRSIQHPQPGFGVGSRGGAVTGADDAQDSDRPVPIVQSSGPLGRAAKITAFGKERRPEDHWQRKPNVTGKGAVHVKTFHCKLTDDALAYMDQSINEWLDAHPQYEVKFVNSTIGMLTGKLKEPALICQVWV